MIPATNPNKRLVQWFHEHARSQAQVAVAQTV